MLVKGGSRVRYLGMLRKESRWTRMNAYEGGVRVNDEIACYSLALNRTTGPGECLGQFNRTDD